jgi:hypothetical protein
MILLTVKIRFKLFASTSEHMISPEADGCPHKQVEKVMKYVVTVSLALLSASPAFAGGHKGGGSLLGGVLAPITTAVSALNINALNNVSILSGNKTNATAIVPVSLKNVGVLSGLLGGGSHGCGCN